MKNNRGITLTALVIVILILIILASVTINISKETIKRANLEDLKTNLLLIQAKAKTFCEEVTFKTANLDSSKEEDVAKIQEIKTAEYKGTALDNCEHNIKSAAADAGISDFTNYYYLNNEDLSQLGVNIEPKEDEYYLVKYDISDVEVVYTRGYKANDGNTYYKLSDINKIEN